MLLLALEGRTELLQAIFGGSGGGKPAAKGSKMTVEGFKAFRDRHNRRYVTPRGRRAAGEG